MLAPAQDRPERAGPSFEVASVKPAPTQGRFSCPGALIGNRFTSDGVLLKPLLLNAYGVTDDLFRNGPAWLGTDKFDIEAKAPEGIGNDQFKTMVRHLLEDRFGLQVHWEEVEMPIYELLVAQGGPKLKAPEKLEVEAAAPPKMKTNKDGYPEFAPGVPAMFATRVKGAQWVTARMKSVAELLEFLHGAIGRPVVDKTGLTGVFDFNLRYSRLNASTAVAGDGAEPLAAAEPMESAPSILGAFETQLGLKLQPKMGPIKVLVVDRINRMPTRN
jgi:uncharacterized protein (TIGR03435 family)